MPLLAELCTGKPQMLIQSHRRSDTSTVHEHIWLSFDSLEEVYFI